jgi:hypothetical protein
MLLNQMMQAGNYTEQATTMSKPLAFVYGLLFVACCFSFSPRPHSFT